MPNLTPNTEKGTQKPVGKGIKRLESEETTQKESLLIEKNNLVFEYEPSPSDMVKRWGQCDDRWINFMRAAKPGDIYELEYLF